MSKLTDKFTEMMNDDKDKKKDESSMYIM